MRWRYLSLAKLIYLLEEKSLFLTPLSYFMETDPVEGYFIFGEKNVEEYRGVKNFPIATLLIKRKDNEEIIKVNLNENKAHNKS